MAKYAAFLRGMNLGRRRLTNLELARCFEDLGFDDVQVFLASGNVAFVQPRPDRGLAKRIEAGLRSALGYDVPTFLRSAAEVRTAAAARPFAQRPSTRRVGKPQVAFLLEPASKATARAVHAFASEDDWLALEGSELHWWPKHGVARSGLDWKGLERVVGTVTVRTQQTLARMAAKCFAE